MMKAELAAAVNATREETRVALQTVYDSLNHGQQSKLLKDETVKKLLELYEVKV